MDKIELKKLKTENRILLINHIKKKSILRNKMLYEKEYFIKYIQNTLNISYDCVIYTYNLFNKFKDKTNTVEFWFSCLYCSSLVYGEGITQGRIYRVFGISEQTIRNHYLTITK
jgi:transcription initiation factor TFIIIB Brf1 subunit/transcription initiation factor TFIIB